MFSINVDVINTTERGKEIQFECLLETTQLTDPNRLCQPKWSYYYKVTFFLYIQSSEGHILQYYGTYTSGIQNLQKKIGFILSVILSAD